MFLVRALGFSDLRTNTRLYSGNNVRAQLRLRQDGELQGLSGNSGGGRSSLQTPQTRKYQQVCVCFLVHGEHSFHVLLNKPQACVFFV